MRYLWILHESIGEQMNNKHMGIPSIIFLWFSK